MKRSKLHYHPGDEVECGGKLFRYTNTCVKLAEGVDLERRAIVLLADNEDWISVDRDHVHLVHAEPDDGPAFIGMTYGPLMLSRFCLSVVGTRFPMNSPASRSSSWDGNDGSGESLSRPTR